MKPHVWSLTHWISCPAALLACACAAEKVSKQSARSDPSSGLVISDVTVIGRSGEICCDGLIWTSLTRG